MDAPYRWIESTSWELDFFGLPHRIPWPVDADEKLAHEVPIDTEQLVRGIEMLGPDAVGPWQGFKRAIENFDELAESLEDGEFPRASELLDEFEAAHPGTSFVLFHKAIVARMDGQFPEAIKLYQAATEKTPQIAEIWRHLGASLAQENRRDEAVAHLTR